MTEFSPNFPMPKLTIIAGSDCSGVAGIQADMATCFGLKVHPQTAMTAVTAQHGEGVVSINAVDSDVLGDQLDAIDHDGGTDAIKIGLVANQKQAKLIAQRLAKKKEWGPGTFTVWDPVLASTTGKQFSSNFGWAKSLLPYIDLITPNIDEAERLTGSFIQTPEDMLLAAKSFQQKGCRGVWLKGGHRQFADYPDKIIDLVYWDGKQTWLVQDRLAVKHSRGTGCTLASAMACFYLQRPDSAMPNRVLDAIVLASAYVHQGLRQGYAISSNAGPIARLGWPMQYEDYPEVVDDLSWLGSPVLPDCGNTPLGLYPVVDSVSWLEKLMNAGVPTIQLRIKDLPSEQLETQIQAAVELSKSYSSRLFINDYWQLAIKYGAYGVHLGQEDLENADFTALKEANIRIGLSTHGEYEWARAASLNPSYLAIGAIYPTQTKEVIIVGPEKLKIWVSILKEHFPLTAIGGINLNNLDEVLDSGIDSVAVVSAITKAGNYQRVVEEFSCRLSK